MSSLKLLSTADLRADLILSREPHYFGTTALQIKPQVSSDVFEFHPDTKPADSAAGPVAALEAAEASGRFARAVL